MKNENIANSTLHVVASETVQAENDMNCPQKHSISELLHEKEEKTEDKKDN